jgi:hypothetical protein
MKIRYSLIAAAVVALGAASSSMAQEKVLRLLTWADYAPADIVAQFEKESGYKVELTLSNNEEMISKLRATGGAGFDLAQPSQDRITGPQQEFGSTSRWTCPRSRPSCSSRRCSTPPRRTPRCRQGVWSAAHLGHRWPGGQHQAGQDGQLHRPVQGRLQGQDRDAPEAPDAAGVCICVRQRPVCPVHRQRRRPTPR